MDRPRRAGRRRPLLHRHPGHARRMSEGSADVREAAAAGSADPSAGSGVPGPPPVDHLPSSPSVSSRRHRCRRPGHRLRRRLPSRASRQLKRRATSDHGATDHGVRSAVGAVPTTAAAPAATSPSPHAGTDTVDVAKADDEVWTRAASASPSGSSSWAWPAAGFVYGRIRSSPRRSSSSALVASSD